MGSRAITLMTIWDAFASYDPTSASETVVREMRVPRTLLGLTVGAALGLSGAILQGVTRNPLAEPGIMGINSGAAAFIVFGIMVLGTQQLSTYIWLGFLGAAVATVAVYVIASFGREGATPVKLALAGAAVTAAFYSLTNAIVMTNVEALNELRFWQVGSLAGRYMPVFWQTLPFIVIGLVVALGSGRALNALALGDDVARALGQRVRLTRFTLFAAVAVLCGAATAACGPIVVRRPGGAARRPRCSCGPDYRWILAYSLLLTPIVLLGCRHRRPASCRRVSCRSASCSASSERRCSSRSSGSGTWCSCDRHRSSRPSLTAVRPRPRPPSAPGRRRHRSCSVLLAFALFVVTMMVGSYVVSPVGRRRLHLPPASTTRPSTSSCATCACRSPRPRSSSGSRWASPGIVFQTLLANPLASPDFVGVSSGASLFAISAIVLFQTSRPRHLGLRPCSVRWPARAAHLRAGLAATASPATGSSSSASACRSSCTRSSATSSLGADIYEAREAMTWLVGSVGQAGPTELLRPHRRGGRAGAAGTGAGPAAAGARARRRRGDGARRAGRGAPGWRCCVSRDR